MGDFNYPEIDWLTQSVDSSARVDCKGFLDTVEDCFFIQHVLDHTRDATIRCGHRVFGLRSSTPSTSTSTSRQCLPGSRFTREPDLVSEVETGDKFSSSDHNMITFKIHHSSPSTIKKPMMRNYQKGDYDSIRRHLTAIEWDTCMSGSANDSWQTLKDLLLTLEEKFGQEYRISTVTKLNKNKTYRSQC